MVALPAPAAHRLETRRSDPNRGEAAAGQSDQAPASLPSLFTEVPVPRDIAFTACLAGAAELMRPVPAPAEVWERVQREFAVGRVERLPLRARLLDVLEQLDHGHLLALMGSTTPRAWLNGCPDITLLASVLFTYDYVQIAGRHRENRHVVYFTLSDAGRRKLHEGRAWWNGLTLCQRLRVRLLG
jgi:hypothetical protein